MNAVTAGATQTFICDPGESVRECLREAEDKEGEGEGGRWGGGGQRVKKRLYQ